MSPAQCRAARGLLDWTQADLAEAAEVAVRTVGQFERSDAAPIRANLAVMRAALEGAGITFIDGDAGVGVVLRARKPRKGRKGDGA